jgi:hypothetical protein
LGNAKADAALSAALRVWNTGIGLVGWTTCVKREKLEMTSRKVFSAATLLTLAVAPGFAQACTQQEAMAKSTQLSQLVQAKMAQDPSQGQALMAKMQPIMQASQPQMSANGTADWDKICGEYDALIKQAQ